MPGTPDAVSEPAAGVGRLSGARQGRAGAARGGRLTRDGERVPARERAQLIIRLRHPLDGAAVLTELTHIGDADGEHHGALRELTHDGESRRAPRERRVK